jgi:hypothetical protein
MATTKITNPDLFNLESLNTALKLPSGTTAERPTSPSTGEWRYNTTTNLVEFWDGGAWRDLQSEEIPPTPSEHFNIVLYDGTSATHPITGVGFQPDLVWIKDRGNAESHIWNDSTRGAGNDLSSNSVNAQANRPTGFTSFDSDGFTLGTDSGGVVNDSARGPYVAWCWKAGGGTTSSNTEGSITSDVQANTKAGFSLVKFTGTGANGTVGHGLGVAPEIIIFNNYLAISGWKMFTNQTTDPANQVMELSDPSGTQTPTNPFNSTLPTSSVFSLGTYGDVNASGGTFIAYCFASVAGYSKIGKYQGNASQDGPLVETGFEPALLIVKNTSGTSNWRMVDNKRNPLNHRQRTLFPNLNNAESNTTDDAVDFLSTGFKISNDDSSWNANADQFLYIAFASDPTAAPTLSDSFANRLYTGNATSNRAITGLGFSPSWVWIKNRSSARDHMEFDNVRLLGSELVPGNYTNLDAADFNTTANDFNSFDTDGFTVGQDPYTNENGSNMVAWCWKANPIPAINNDGDIQSIVSANQAAGFSIVTYTGNSTSGATVGHGLTVAPDAIIIKCMNTGSTNWINYYETIGVNDYLTLNLNNALDTFSNWFASNATTFTLNNTFGNANTTGRTYVAYCFKSTAGFSKMGSYTGTGSAGNAQNVGFTPSWVMIKRTNSISDWYMFDTARGDTSVLLANSSAAQFTNTNFNLTSTGFDFDGTDFNEAGSSWIYMAFKETQYPKAGTMSFLNIAGGGGGGASSTSSGSAAGGGAGGLRTSHKPTSGGGSGSESDITLAAGTYTITVGSGGGGASYTGAFYRDGSDGSDSSISATGLTTITSIGGGGGGGMLSGGRTGGSGGGRGSGGGYYGAAGTANQGFDGGYDPAATQGGGGGGAASVGGFGTSGQGSGLSVDITGSAVTYAAGGNGNVNNGSPSASTANTGDGGQGSGSSSSGAGGASGVVILKLLTSEYSSSTTGSPTVTTDGDYTILTYTGSGTYVHS